MRPGAERSATTPARHLWGEPDYFGIDVSGAVVGERWAVGSAVLQVTEPRLPSFNLGIRMADFAFPLVIWQEGSVRRLSAYPPRGDRRSRRRGSAVGPAGSRRDRAGDGADAVGRLPSGATVLHADDLPDSWRVYTERLAARIGESRRSPARVWQEGSDARPRSRFRLTDFAGCVRFYRDVLGLERSLVMREWLRRLSRRRRDVRPLSPGRDGGGCRRPAGADRGDRPRSCGRGAWGREPGGDCRDAHPQGRQLHYPRSSIIPNGEFARHTCGIPMATSWS